MEVLVRQPCVYVCVKGGGDRLFVCCCCFFVCLFVCWWGFFLGGGGVVVGYILGYINAFDKVCSHLNI